MTNRDRDWPSVEPPRHILTAVADEIVADVRHYYGTELDERHARALRGDIIARLVWVRDEAARSWLGSAVRRAAEAEDD